MNIRVVHVYSTVRPGAHRVYVGRWYAGRFGNHTRAVGPRSAKVQAFRVWLKTELREQRTELLDELAQRCLGHEQIELACHCGDDTTNCHAHVWKQALEWWLQREYAYAS